MGFFKKDISVIFQEYKDADLLQDTVKIQEALDKKLESEKNQLTLYQTQYEGCLTRMSNFKNTEAHLERKLDSLKKEVRFFCEEIFAIQKGKII